MNQKIFEIVKKIEEADAIIVAASNGLSITEGYHLFAEDKAFEELLGDFRDQYNIHNLLQGMTFHYPTEEIKWAFWSRVITKYVLQYTTTPIMKNLKELINNKPYFIVTSNGEAHFEATGFNPEFIYEIEGNLLHMQCANACHEKIYPLQNIIREMVALEKNGYIPKELVPKCEKCGGEMHLNYAVHDTFIPAKNAQYKFQMFLEQYHNKKIIVLELGIGWKNKLIKAPLMELVQYEPNSTYITINKGEIHILNTIKNRSYGLDGDLTVYLSELNSILKEREFCQSIRQTYQKWYKFLEEKVDFTCKNSDHHTKEHCARVMILAFAIAHYKGVLIEYEEQLAIAAAFHDARRKDDGLDVGHGARAASYYRKYSYEQGQKIDMDIFYVIYYHDIDDDISLREIELALHKNKNWQLFYQIFKDADALDRLRLGKDALSQNFLRTNEAGELIGFSKRLLAGEYFEFFPFVKR